MVQVYMYSWHHLTGYITQLEISPDSLDAIALGRYDWTREHGYTSEWPPRRIQMKRSQAQDLRDPRQRVKFFTAIGAIVLHGLSRYNMYQKVIAEICKLEE